MQFGQAADHPVVAAFQRQMVVAGAAGKRVRPAVAIQRVIAIAALDPVVVKIAGAAQPGVAGQDQVFDEVAKAVIGRRMHRVVAFTGVFITRSFSSSTM